MRHFPHLRDPRGLRDPASVARTVLAAVVLVVLAALPAPAAAQLSVDSLIRTLHPADSTTSLEIAVRNGGDHGVAVRIELADWEITEDGGHRFHPVGTLAGSCGEAVVAGPAGSAGTSASAASTASAASGGLHLAAGETVSVRVSYSGGAGDVCRVMVWFRTDDVPFVGDEGVTFIVRTGVKLYVEPRRDGS